MSFEVLTITPAAFLAGLLMFLAPCTLPLVPGYLAFIAGVPYGEVGRGKTSAQRRVLVNAIMFVIGFSCVFILLGMFASLLGSLLGEWREILARAAGAIVVVFGLSMMGLFEMPFLGTERRLALPRFLTVGRPESSLLIGSLFALGWSPCVGPILGTVLLFASAKATLLQGGLLLFVFSLGLGVPFILSALLLTHTGRAISRFAPMFAKFSLVGGVLLVVFGLLLLTGTLGSVVPADFIEAHLFWYNWSLSHI